MELQAWLDARKLGVTGTDIGVLMGVNPYKNVDQLILDKLGVGKPFIGNNATKAGVILEPIVAAEWAKRNGQVITQGVFKIHPEYPRYVGTPDFLCEVGGVEIKTGAEKMYAKGCPPYYEMQSRWYMFLEDRPYWDLVACIVPKDRSIILDHQNDPEFLLEFVRNCPHREFRFDRDHQVESQMKHLADQFLAKMDALRQPRQVPDWLRPSE